MKRKLGNLLLALAGTVTAVVIAEFVLRVVNLGYPHFARYDRYTGFALRPGASGMWTGEGRSQVTINSAGLRDQEHALEKPPNTLRVAVLGDSFSEAFQVEASQTYWAVAGGALDRSCAALRGRKTEVINFGVGGYGTAQEYITLNRRVWQYSPDIVILQYYANDVGNNSRALDPIKTRPFFYYRDGELLLDNSFRRDKRFKYDHTLIGRIRTRLRDHSRVLQVIAEVKYHLPWRQKSRHGDDGWGVFRGGDIPPPDERWRQAWKVTEVLIERVYQETVSHGVRFLLVLVSDPLAVWPDPAMRARLLQEGGQSDVGYNNRRIGLLARREGIEALDLNEPFLKYGEEHHVFLHGFPNSKVGLGHWNAAGHHLAGELVAAKLCQMLGQGETGRPDGQFGHGSRPVPGFGRASGP